MIAWAFDIFILRAHVFFFNNIYLAQKMLCDGI